MVTSENMSTEVGESEEEETLSLELFLAYLTLPADSECPFKGCSKEIDVCKAKCNKKTGPGLAALMENVANADPAADAVIECVMTADEPVSKAALVDRRWNHLGDPCQEPDTTSPMSEKFKEIAFKWIRLLSFGTVIPATRWHTIEIDPPTMECFENIESELDCRIAETEAWWSVANLPVVRIDINDTTVWKDNIMNLKAFGLRKFSGLELSSRKVAFAKAQDAALSALSAIYMRLVRARPFMDTLYELFHSDQELMQALASFMRRAQRLVPQVQGKRRELCPWVKLARYELLKLWVGQEQIMERLDKGQLYNFL